MLSRLFGRTRARTETAGTLYAAIVAQARAPGLYAALGAPDTVSGRFEMVILHTVLVLRRLQEASPAEAAVGQSVFDLFCRDMDRSLRELGVGDFGVPKRMRQVGEAFYGRAQVYGDCLTRTDERGLAEALRRNVLKGSTDDQSPLRLARYALAAATALTRVAPHDLLLAPVPFPDPAQFAAAGVGAAA
jgi:cytochrome b pre-mRNA-processing protein 3